MLVVVGWSEDVVMLLVLKKFEEKLVLGFCDLDEGYILFVEECE